MAFNRCRQTYHSAAEYSVIWGMTPVKVSTTFRGPRVLPIFLPLSYALMTGVLSRTTCSSALLWCPSQASPATSGRIYSLGCDNRLRFPGTTSRSMASFARTSARPSTSMPSSEFRLIFKRETAIRSISPSALAPPSQAIRGTPTAGYALWLARLSRPTWACRMKHP